MMHRHQPIVVASIVATLAILCAACSEGTAGQATTTSPTPMRGSTSSSTSSKHTGNPFASTDPCVLLDKALTGKGFPPGQFSDIGSENGCRTGKPQVASYSVNLMSGRSLDTFGDNPANLHDGDVNGRPAVQLRERKGSEGSCFIAMAVPPKSLAYVAVQFNGTTEEACKRLTEVAKKIEPMLPGGK